MRRRGIYNTFRIIMFWTKKYFHCLFVGLIAYIVIVNTVKWQMARRTDTVLKLNKLHVTHSINNWKDGGISPGTIPNTSNTVSTLHHHDGENKASNLPRDNITVAVFSCNPHWLFETKLDRGPTIYGCPKTNRTLTVKSAFRDADLLHDADVVIFAAGLDDLDLWDQVVEGRRAHQIWVYSTAESAYSSPQIRDPAEDRLVGFGTFRFNMSFGYHSTSEVVAPFGEYLPERGNRGKRVSNVSSPRGKKNMVAWVSSHCDDQFWNRTGFVHRLSTLIPVHTYGSCGRKRLPRHGPEATKTLQTYKFYLALENSCCSEYISEKLWLALAEFQTVPIVVGPSRSDYEKVAPPNSFIFANDFDSLQGLSRYLRKLSRNATLYNQYHAWRGRGVTKVYSSKQVYPFTSRESACALLAFLEQNAWKDDDDDEDDKGALEMKLDPFSGQWLGSCRACSGGNAWMRPYDLNSDAFTPKRRNRTMRADYRLRERLETYYQKMAAKQ